MSRQLDYPDPAALQLKINEYFESVKDENVERNKRRFEGMKPKPFTISGLCVFLDISRETWQNYSNRTEYTDIILKARLRVENHTEEGLLNGSLQPIGAIFSLKNNFQWIDRVDLNATSGAPEQLSASDIRKQLEQRRTKELIESTGEIVDEDSI